MDPCPQLAFRLLPSSKQLVILGLSGPVLQEVSDRKDGEKQSWPRGEERASSLHDAQAGGSTRREEQLWDRERVWERKCGQPSSQQDGQTEDTGTGSKSMVSPRGEETEDRPPCSCLGGRARPVPRGGLRFFPERLVPTPRRAPDMGVLKISF